jgi:hypothetical protein
LAKGRGFAQAIVAKFPFIGLSAVLFETGWEEPDNQANF